MLPLGRRQFRSFQGDFGKARKVGIIPQKAGKYRQRRPCFSFEGQQAGQVPLQGSPKSGHFLGLCSTIPGQGLLPLAGIQPADVLTLGEQPFQASPGWLWVFPLKTLFQWLSQELCPGLATFPFELSAGGSVHKSLVEETPQLAHGPVQVAQFPGGLAVKVETTFLAMSSARSNRSPASRTRLPLLRLVPGLGFTPQRAN
jgi:hypothetical protein